MSACKYGNIIYKFIYIIIVRIEFSTNTKILQRFATRRAIIIVDVPMYEPICVVHRDFLINTIKGEIMTISCKYYTRLQNNSMT